MRSSGWIGGVSVLLAGAAISTIGFIDLCNMVFGCGCRSLWDGAAQDCNIHLSVGRHCPWCENPSSAGGVAFAAVMLTQSVVSFWPMNLGLWVRLTIAIAALPIVGGTIGLLQGLLSGYWN